MEHLNKGDYANGDPVEAIYYVKSKTFVYQARSKLVDEDASQICMPESLLYRLANTSANFL